MGSTINSEQSDERVIRRHAAYYIQGGDTVFRVRKSVITIVFCRVPLAKTMILRQVEDTLFKVHGYFFTRGSTFFHSKLRHPPPPGEFRGVSDVHPLVLEDIRKLDFERFLWVFYSPCVHSLCASPPLNNR